MIANPKGIPEIAQKICKNNKLAATTSSKGHCEFYYTNVT